MRIFGSLKSCLPIGWTLGAALLLLSMQGCGGVQTADNPFQRAEAEERVVLRVENRNDSDARIFIRPRGRRTPLAEVRSRDLVFLEFAWPRGMPLDLEVDLLAGGRFRPSPLPMNPGIRVELIIAADVRRSVLRQ
jgi:hypothetical protein